MSNLCNNDLTPDVKTELIQHADRVLFYMKKQAIITSQLNAEDPTRLSKLISEQRMDSGVNPLQALSGGSEDPMEMIKLCDEALKEELHSFEDRFKHLQVAFTALTLYQTRVLGPVFSEDLASLAFVSSYIAERHHNDPEIFPNAGSSPSLQKVRPKPPHGEKRNAQEGPILPINSTTISELLQDVHTLMKKQFRVLPGHEDDDVNASGEWHIESLRLADPGDRGSNLDYWVWFDKLDGDMPYSKKGVMELLAASTEV